MKQLLSITALALLAACSCSKDDNSTPTPGPNTGTPVKTTSATVKLAWTTATTPNPTCFLDVDSGAVYNITTAPAHAAEIDFYWAARPFYNDAAFSSPDEDDALIGGTGTMTYAGDLKITSWAQRNHTIVEGTTDVTAADFDAVQTVAQLKALWDKDKPALSWFYFEGESEQLGRIYIIETAQHKKGLMKFTTASFGQGGSANVQIKIEP